MRNRLDQLRQRLAHLKGQRTALMGQRSRLTTEANTSRKEQRTCGQAAMVLIELQKTLTAASEEKAEQLLTLGLNTTFSDQPQFKVILESERRRGINNLDLFLEFGGKKMNPDDFGGGILATLSLLFQAVVVKRAGLAPCLFIDERLNFVSPAYRPRILELLRRLCDEAGFDIMMTTNEEDFVFNADGAQVPDLVLEVAYQNSKLVVVEQKRR